ncbi:MAG: membrane-bound lytic murein transglycosylase MltF [Gammaproteobacteria bacterium]|nr:membrane-bound lytic murein transglycosylase MltF [Gammaproteobacteria bacterium]
MRHLLIILACSGLVTCSQTPSLLAQIQALGELRVVTRNSLTTYYVGLEGPMGPEYELARGLADQLGVGLYIYTPDSFDTTLAELISNRAHVAAAGLTVTPARRTRVDFGPPYGEVYPQLVQRLGAPQVRSLEALAALEDVRLQVLAGSSHVELLERLAKLHPTLHWEAVQTVDVDELLSRVANGDADFTLVDSSEFQVARHLYPELRAVFDVGEPEPVAWALTRRRNDPSLREAVSRYFAALEAEAELAGLFQRYLEPVGDYDYVSTRAFVTHFDTRLPKYRDYFHAAATETGFDWRLLAAVGYQESHWNPKAVSPTGVRGIMMLTQRTANALEIEDRVDPFQSIMGGARYLAQQHARIPDRIPEPDRTWLALAAYNIGWGHLEDARVLTEINGADPDSWADVRDHLPLLTQRQWYSRVRRGFARGWQPVHYVDNIQRYYQVLQWMTAGEQIAEEELIAGPGRSP